MKRIFLLGFISLLISACANQKVHNLYDGKDAQAAIITSSPTVLVKYVDDDPVSAGFIGQVTRYRVASGQHTVLVEYSDLFEITNDEHEKLVSRPAKVTFTAQAGNTYQVINEKQSTLEQARAFAEKPDFSVIDVKTKQPVQTVVELSRPRTFLTQLRSAVTPVYEFDSDKVNAGVAETVSVSGAQNSLEALQKLWSGASEADRDAFKRWIEAQ